MKKIIFLGTNHFAAELLKKLIRKKFCITHVFTKPNRKMGRGQKLKNCPVKNVGKKYKIPTYTYKSINSKEAMATIKTIKPLIILMVEYGEKINEALIKIPKYGIMNIHPSILPSLKGPTPIENTIILGKTKTGISIIKINKYIDAGIILNFSVCDIKKYDTYKTLSKRLVKIIPPILSKTLKILKKNKPIIGKETGEIETHTQKFEKKFYKIDWNDSAITIDRLIRSTYNIKKHYTKFKNIEIRIIKTTIIKNTKYTLPPGTIVKITKYGIDVMTKKGILRIKELQFPGKKINNAKDTFNSKKNFFKILDTFE